MWPLVTDIALPARFSAEFHGAEWLADGAPVLGAVFRGQRQRGHGQLDDDGSLLRLRVRLGPGPSGLTAAIAERPDAGRKMVAWRLADLRANMQATGDGIAVLAEAAGPAPTGRKPSSGR